MYNIEKFPIWRVTKEGKRHTYDLVTRELPLAIILNNRELTTLLCSPTEQKYLAVGFLCSEGIVKDRNDINSITIDNQKGSVRVEVKEDKNFANKLISSKHLITSGCGKGVSFYNVVNVKGQTKVESQTVMSALEILSLVKEFQHYSEIYRATGGVHSAALCNTKRILAFSEDIGRHNAIDKIFGQCLLENMPTEDHIIITSGRITSEILLKVFRRNIPIIVSKSAPTDMGIRLADDLGITLIGFVRGKRMNAYTNDWRIVSDGG